MQIGDTIIISGSDHTVTSISNNTYLCTSAWYSNASDVSFTYVHPTVNITADSNQTALIIRSGSLEPFQIYNSGGSRVFVIETNGSVYGASLVTNGYVGTGGSAGTSTGALQLQSGNVPNSGFGPGNSGTVNLTSGYSQTGSSGGVNISSGYSTAGNSGNISIDVGTASGSLGQISIGTANASALTIGNSAATVALQGGPATTITAGSGSNTTTLAFAAPSGVNTVSLPAASGTICLEASSSCGFLTGSSDGAANYIARWTSATNLGTGEIYDNGSVVGVGTANPFAAFDIESTGTVHSGTGTVSTYYDTYGHATACLTGSGTSFTSQLHAGDEVLINGSSWVVSSVPSDSEVCMNSGALPTSISNSSFTFVRPGQRIGADTDQTALVLQAGNNSNDVFQVNNSAGNLISYITSGGTIAASNFEGSSLFTYGGPGGEPNSTTSGISINTGALTVGGNTGSINIVTGNTANGTTGSINIDNGVATTGTNGQINIGTANASGINIGSGSTSVALQGNTNLTSSSGTALTIQAASGQSADLFQLQDSSANVISGFNSSGSLFFASPSYNATLNTNTLTDNRTIALPDASGTVCLEGSSDCNFLIGSPGDYIKSQYATAQPANFNIVSSDDSQPAATITGSSSASAPLLVLAPNTPQTGQTILTVNNGSSSLFNIDDTGRTTIGGSAESFNSQLLVTDSYGPSDRVNEILQSSSGQTADLLRLQTSDGAILSGFNASGGLFSNGANNIVNSLASPAFTTTSTGTSYYYEVTATNSIGETVASTSRGMADDTHTLTWDQVPGATGYKLYRSISESFTSGALLLTTINSGTTTTYTDAGNVTTAGLPPTVSTAGNPLSINGVTTANASTSAAQLLIGTGNAANTGLVIQSTVSQTADLFQAQDSTGALLATIDYKGDLSVKSATVNGTLTVNGHIVSGNDGSGSTSASTGAGAGSSATVTIHGNDTTGTITVVVGSGPSAGILAKINFASGYSAAPHAIISPDNANGAAAQPFLSTSAGSLSVNTRATPVAGQTYIFDYIVVQ